jgi:hypothetical protein
MHVRDLNNGLKGDGRSAVAQLTTRNIVAKRKMKRNGKSLHTGDETRCKAEEARKLTANPVKILPRPVHG